MSKRVHALAVLSFAALLMVPSGASAAALRESGETEAPTSDREAAGEASRLPDAVDCPGCWHPAVQTSWQWQLSRTLDTSVDVQVYDIDLFDNSAETVAGLHAAGRKVVCYTSAGSVEDWRPDADAFPARVIGKELDGWKGERWLDIRKRRILRPIMQERVDLCAQKGFDGIEFDNVDAWSNDPGFPLTRMDQLRYNIMLANMAHTAGLGAAMKNDVEQVRRLLPYFDMHLDEECFRYDECDRLLPFVEAGKLVFEVEYELEAADFCPEANAMNLNAMKKKLNLGAWRDPCR
jgi:hypothetical protein